MEAVEIYRPDVVPRLAGRNATERIQMDVDAPYTTPKPEWQLIRRRLAARAVRRLPA